MNRRFQSSKSHEEKDTSQRAAHSTKGIQRIQCPDISTDEALIGGNKFTQYRERCSHQCGGYN